MKFVAFSGEEQGLFGSEAYVRELYEQQTPVLVEFNADGIGRSTTTETGKKIRLSAPKILHGCTYHAADDQRVWTRFHPHSLLEVNRGLPFGLVIISFCETWI